METIVFNHPRRNFINLGKITNYNIIPDLISVVLQSYSNFLQKDVDPKKRKKIGLEQVFKESFLSKQKRLF